MVIRVCKGREQVSDANMLVIVAGLFLTISTSFCRIGFDMFQQIKSNKFEGENNGKHPTAIPKTGNSW